MDAGHARKNPPARLPASRRRAWGATAGALCWLVLIARADARLSADLPVELLYLPAIAAVAWYTRPAWGYVVAVLSAVAPSLLGVVAGTPPGQGVGGAALRVAAFVGLVVATLAARARWCELLAMSHTDSLTGLANHGAFSDAVARELARQKRDGGAVGVLCLDVDGFKRLNDAQGHAAGDRVLAGIASVLRGNVRASDIVARTGGDEFAVLLPGCTANAAAVVREHLRAMLASWADEQRHEIGFSFGVAASDPVRPLDATALIARADADMYREKNAHHAETGVYERPTWASPRSAG
jgi:diguanylate cyclase (GGDEF)-like protein